MRLDPLTQPYEPRLAEAFRKIMPSGLPPLVLFRTLGRNRRVFDRMMAGSLLDRGALDLRDRELVILRTCARCEAWYEFDVHVAFFAERVGLTPMQVADLRSPGISPDVWPPREELILKVTDELHDDIDISDASWERLKPDVSDEQILELLALAGYYRTISIFVRSLRLPPEPFTAQGISLGDADREASGPP